MKNLEHWITHHWYSHKKTWLAYLLLPFAFIFSIIVQVRRWCYQKKMFKTYRAPCPVIIVGNITVGGVGKTPLIIALYFFLKQRGWSPGIVSRGYTGSYKNVAWVTAESDVNEVGDEALLLALRTQAPIAIARDRVLAVKTLLQKSSCNIILSDDGLQHYALERDIEIAVIDANRQHGNALCLPAGPLREPLLRLTKVDLVVFNGGAESQCAFTLMGAKLVNLACPQITQPLQNLCHKKVHAIAGIGFPQRFFDYLKSFELDVVEHAYPDHYHFQENDFSFVNAEDILIMTEKDAVKCRAFARSSFWFLPIEADFNALFVEFFEACFSKIV